MGGYMSNYKFNSILQQKVQKNKSFAQGFSIDSIDERHSAILS
jgi:hypothetical protein